MSLVISGHEDRHIRFFDLNSGMLSFSLYILGSEDIGIGRALINLMRKNENVLGGKGSVV